jgi:hypothetical protein
MIKKFKHFLKHKKNPVKENSVVPANAMGGSSSTAGTGGIDTYDPFLKNKKILKRNPIS